MIQKSTYCEAKYIAAIGLPTHKEFWWNPIIST